MLLLVALLAAGHMQATKACTGKVDLTILIDSSSSICGGAESCREWDSIIQFSKDLVDSLTIGPSDSRVACITISDKAYVEWNFKQYTNKTSLSSAFDSVKYSGGELIDIWSIHGALTEIFNPRSVDNVDFVGILITDGSSEFPPVVYELLYDLIQTIGPIKIFVVCIKPGCTKELARHMASPSDKPNRNYFLLDNYLLLDSVKENLEKKICSS